MDDSWFFGRNENKNKQPIIDNTLGVIISKKDLSLNLCFEGTKEQFSLEKGKVLDISNDYLKQNTEEEREFNKYCELYKEKFGKNAYIAEPNGTREQTINAIKTCLEKNEDLLDKLLYPNFDKDMKD